VTLTEGETCATSMVQMDSEGKLSGISSLLKSHLRLFPMSR